VLHHAGVDDATILVLALGIGVPLFIALVIGIILLVGRARPVAGLGVQVAPPAGPGAPQRVRGTWNGEILGEGGLGAIGGTMASTFGSFHVEDGWLSFTPVDAAEPAWRVPGHTVVGRRRGLVTIDGADVELWTPVGHLRCNVSREHINRISRNDIKDGRERGYAQEFLWALGANGARSAP
jgi:hypothetical protein